MNRGRAAHRTGTPGTAYERQENRTSSNVHGAADEPEHGVSAPRQLLITSLGCVLIAAVLWALVPSLGRWGFASIVVHSQLIGLSIATLCILAYRHLLPERPSRIAAGSANALCTVLGFVTGTLSARLVLGLPLLEGRSFGGTAALTATVLTTLIASIGFIAHFRSRARVAALAWRAAEDARRADAARLSMLRAQLDPHMLFNTLANLRALIATDPRGAQRMVDHLVPFLRATLDGSREDRWSLEQEFDELRHYLEIMAIRLGRRLTFELNLPPSLGGVEVPALLLQPLVENAVRHGIEPSVSGGRIGVTAERPDRDTLVITVHDTAREGERPGDPGQRSGDAGHAPRARFGLESVRERLRLIYADSASLTIRTVPEDDPHATGDAGTRVTIRLPSRLGAPTETSS